MPLPETIRVKLSSESAGTIALTAVVVEELPLRELIERMLPVAGKNPARIGELLRRGSLVSGASRFRWTGWEVDSDALGALLATLPESDPGQPFAAGRTIRAVLRGPRCRIEIEREAAEQRRLFHRRSFWQALMELAPGGTLEYVEYSYEHRADCHRLPLDAAGRAALRAGAAALSYPALAAQVRAADVTALDFYVARSL